MERWISTSRVVSGPPELLADRLRRDPVALFCAERGMHGIADEAHKVVVDLPAPADGVALAKHARIDLGPALVPPTGDRRMLVPLSWRAEPASALFPVFEGALELTPTGPERAALRLHGRVRVPLGPLGDVSSLAGLSRLAQQTVEAVLDQLAAALSLPDDAGERLAPQPAPVAVDELVLELPVVLLEQVPLREAAALLRLHGTSGASIVDVQGAPVGIVSETDLLRATAGRLTTRERPATVGKICTRPALTVTPQTTVVMASRRMLDQDVAQLLVVDDDRILGLFTRADALRVLLRSDAELGAAVAVTLGLLDQPELRAEVVHGCVTLSGATRSGSRLGGVIDRVARIDGVVAVRSLVTELVTSA